MCIYNICSFITDKGLLFDITSCLSNKEIKIFLNCNKDLHKFKKYFVKKIELNEEEMENPGFVVAYIKNQFIRFESYRQIGRDITYAVMSE